MEWIDLFIAQENVFYLHIEYINLERKEKIRDMQAAKSPDKDQTESM